MIIKKYIFYFIPIFVISFFGFIYIGVPSLLGEIEIQAYSDSITYEKIARNIPEGFELLSIKGNFLGPVLLLELLDFNYLYIYLFNTFLILLSIKLLVKYYNLNHGLLLIFIFMNPLILFSLWSINKEILLFFDFVLLLVYLKNRNILFLIFAILFSPFIRWQMTLFFLIIYIVILIDNKIKYRKSMLLFSLVTLSILYPQISFIFEEVIEHASLGGDIDSGKGIYPILNNIQNQIGGYIFVFIPKTMQLLYGQLFRIGNILDFSDFWNNLILMSNTIMTFILSFYIVYKKRFSLDNMLVYIAIFYAMIFTLTPVYNTRYMFPLYIILIVIASQKNQKKETINEKLSH